MGVVIGETAETAPAAPSTTALRWVAPRSYKGAKRHPDAGQQRHRGRGRQGAGRLHGGRWRQGGRRNAVVTKPVPAGATAVGNPARIIQASPTRGARRQPPKWASPAYGVTQNDDPLSQALRGLIDSAGRRSTRLRSCGRPLKSSPPRPSLANCVPGDAARHENFAADKFNALIDK